MKTVIINRNSWHFRAQEFIFKFSSPGDFCSYVRRVLCGTFVIAVLGAVVMVVSGVMLYSTGDFIGWLVSGVFYGFVEIGGGSGFAMLLTFASGGGLCLAVRASAPIIAEHRPDFIVDAYHSLKDRVCYRLEIRG